MKFDSNKLHCNNDVIGVQQFNCKLLHPCDIISCSTSKVYNIISFIEQSSNLELSSRALLNKRLRHSYFYVNFSKFLRTPFLQTPPGRCFSHQYFVNFDILEAFSWKCYIKMVFLKFFFQKSQKSILARVFFHKVTGCRLSTLLKERLWHRCFSMNIVKFSLKPFLQKT